MQIDIQKLKKDLAVSEGVVFGPYLDSEGILTYGIGRNLEANPPSREESLFAIKNAAQPMEIALFFLHNDIERAIETVEEHLPWVVELSEPRRRAIVELSFNMGIDRLLKFNETLPAIREGRFEDAYHLLGKTKWARQVKQTRANRIREQILNG